MMHGERGEANLSGTKEKSKGNESFWPNFSGNSRAVFSKLRSDEKGKRRYMGVDQKVGGHLISPSLRRSLNILQG